MANTLINGVAYGYVNLTFMSFSVPLIGVTALNFKASQKKDNVYTTGVNPNYRAYAEKTYEASLEMIWDQWLQIIDASPTGDPLDIPYSDMQAIFGSTRLVNRTIILQNAEFLVDELTTKQGETHMIVKVPLIISGIVHK